MTDLSISLRPYQSMCVERVIAAYQDQPEGGNALIVLPTGGGKTIVFAEIARRLGLATLVIAHREELLRQAAEKFRLVDPTAIVGQLGAGCHDWGAPVTVASVQTISRPAHLATLSRQDYRLIIVDECHHSAAASYQAVLGTLAARAFVLGVTATPERLDGEDITEVFGQPIFSASILEMVTQGYLCDLRAIAVETGTSLDGLHTRAGDFQQEELEELIDTPERNDRVVRAYLKHARDRQALCFAVTIAHASNLALAFDQAGVRARVVSGETPPEERRTMLLAYERGEIDVLCNVGVLTEGYDAPQTSCIILARPTRSRGLFVQCIGRGTRLAPGKRDCLVLDITDNCLKHRLQPVTLKDALEKEIRDGESIIEALRREERAATEDEARSARSKERRTHVTARAHDQEVNLLGSSVWQRLPNGEYHLLVSAHLVRLVPLELQPGSYAVWANLAPDWQPQCWLKAAPLDWARTFAETKARLLTTGKGTRVLVDTRASWRQLQPTDKQLATLRSLGISPAPGLSRGAAADLISQAFVEKKWRKASEKHGK